MSGFTPYLNAFQQAAQLYQLTKNVRVSDYPPYVSWAKMPRLSMPVPSSSSPKFAYGVNARAKFGGVKTYTKRKKGSYKGKGKLAKIKRDQYIMKKQLRQLPPQPKDLILDQISDRWTSSQGLAAWNATSSAVTTKNAIQCPISTTPTNQYWTLASIPAVDGITAFKLGRSKYIRHEWSLDTRVTNLANCPTEFEVYTLKTRKRVPATDDIHSPLYSQNTFGTLLARAFYNQFNVDAVTSPSKGPNHASFKLTDLQFFNEYFKIVNFKRHVIQPGEALLLKKWSKKPRVFDTSKIYNPSGGALNFSDLQVYWEKNELLYVYRQIGVPQSQESKGAADVTLCDTVLDVVHNLRSRVSIMPYSSYDAVAAPGQLATGQTIKLIFPGTSAAGTAAPAT